MGSERRGRRLMHPLASKALFEEHTRNLSPELTKCRGWKVHLIEFPLIDCAFTAHGRTTLRLKLLCDDWNDLPPSISLHAADGTLLSELPPNPTNVFNSSSHPATGRPFVCMRGAREYHTHSSHVEDLWENLKNNSSYTLGGIMTQLWNAWQKGSG